MTLSITIPLVNPNEPEATLAAIFVKNGDFVHRGQVLCTLETTKATSELESPADGYVVHLPHTTGDALAAGSLFCYIAGDPNWQPAPNVETQAAAVPQDLIISEPAKALALANNIALDSLPRGQMVTTQTIQNLLSAQTTPSADFPLDSTAILVYGGGGHGRTVVELIRALGVYQIVGIIDDGVAPGEIVSGLPVLGGHSVLEPYARQGVRLVSNAVGGIGNLAVRKKVFGHIQQAGLVCPALVHPRSFVEPTASLGAGIQVFALAYVGTDVTTGFGVIVNTGAILSHDCKLGDYVNISPGAILAGGVEIGDNCLVGMGVTINLGAKIGKNVKIGNGATVKADVPDNTIIRAGSIWPA